MTPTGQHEFFYTDHSSHEAYRAPPVRHDHPETSHQAAEAIAPVTGKLRKLVYEYAVARGPAGFIDEDLFFHFRNVSENSLRPRRIELQQSGKLIDSGDRRQNHRGRACVVWRVAA